MRNIMENDAIDALCTREQLSPLSPFDSIYCRRRLRLLIVRRPQIRLPFLVSIFNSLSLSFRVYLANVPIFIAPIRNIAVFFPRFSSSLAVIVCN